MTKNKIEHPYHVPEGFFEFFRSEMLENLSGQQETDRQRIKTLLLNIAKYAAIIVFSFILGRESVSLYNRNIQTEQRSETYSVDAIYSQVSADDITEFIIENNSDNVFN